MYACGYFPSLPRSLAYLICAKKSILGQPPSMVLEVCQKTSTVSTVDCKTRFLSCEHSWLRYISFETRPVVSENWPLGKSWPCAQVFLYFGKLRHWDIHHMVCGKKIAVASRACMRCPFCEWKLLKRKSTDHFHSGYSIHNDKWKNLRWEIQQPFPDCQ